MMKDYNDFKIFQKKKEGGTNINKNKKLTQTEQTGEGGVCPVFWFLSYCE